MEILVSDTLEFVEKCEGYETLPVLLDHFSSVVAQFGFNYFVMTGLPSQGDDVNDLIIADRTPKGWREYYMEQDFFRPDPVTQWSFSSSSPFSWKEAREKTASTKISERIEAEANSIGLVDGLGFPMYDPIHWQAVVSLGSDQPCDLTKRQIGMIYLASVYCQMQASELTKPKQPHIEELTAREREILQWVAAGKSYWETSTILGISEATVHSHLLHVRQKLKVANTTEAVARGLKTRQINY